MPIKYPGDKMNIIGHNPAVLCNPWGIILHGYLQCNFYSHVISSISGQLTVLEFKQ